MLCLGIDTATSRGSVALAQTGEVLAAAALREPGAHAREVLKEIEGLLASRGSGPAALNGIAVAAGPGSFTGLRVGMATAKGLAYALNIPLAGISTLEAMARAARSGEPGGPGVLCVAIEAGRGEVYAALFRFESGTPARAWPDRSCRPADLAAALPADCMLVGDGAGAVVEAGRAAGRSLRSTDCPLLAPAIALWALQALRPGETYRPGTLTPNYIRPSDAEAARRRS